jgi:hypothetical protein
MTVEKDLLRYLLIVVWRLLKRDEALVKMLVAHSGSSRNFVVVSDGLGILPFLNCHAQRASVI